MKRKLKEIARQLTGEDIQELLRIKESEDKRVAELLKKRDRLAAELADIDEQLAGQTGGEMRGKKKPGRRPGRKARIAVEMDVVDAEDKPARRKGKRKGKGRRNNNLSATVRSIFAAAGGPLKASQVVEALPEAGIDVPDISEMRKRISVVLSSQKKYFEPVERGLYQLRQD